MTLKRVMIRRLSIVVLLATLLTSCGTTNNFRAYYNTFYNAELAFERGYETIEKKDERINIDVYLPLFVRPSGNTGSRDFESAVLKSADVLRNHGDSKWVDDALLLIGKSYFYQENIVGALEKFREVIDRGDDLENEARFWLARTMIISRSFEEAKDVLRESVNRENVPDKWLAMYDLSLGELFVRQALWDEAAEAFARGLKNNDEDDISARAEFLLGQIYERMGHWDESFAAYSAVQKKGPLYELSYTAKLSAARVDAFHLDFDRGMKSIRKLQRDDKNYPYEPQILLVRARSLQNNGRYADAYSIYYDLLYKERDIPINPELKGRVHYAVATYYREAENDFVLASAHFDSASTSIVLPGATATTRSSKRAVDTSFYTAEAITDARDLSLSYGQYSAVYEKAQRLDSLLWLGTLDQDTFDAQIMEYREALREQLIVRQREREKRQLAQQFRQSSETSALYADRRLPAGKVISDQSTSARDRAGFLFHKNLARIEEGRASFQNRWGDRPLVSNWRRISAVIIRSDDELVADARLNDVLSTGDITELPELDTSAVPRDSLSRAAMIADRAIVRYDLANSLFLSMNMPDSAAVLYRSVIEESEGDDVSRRAYYALAEVQRALGDTLAAERIYDEILFDFPDSDFALRIRDQRGLIEEEEEIDLDAVAELEFRDIYNRWEQFSDPKVIDDLLVLAVKYPDLEVRAMALLASGRVHLEHAGADSTAILLPVMISLPDTLLNKIWPEIGHVTPVAVRSSFDEGEPVKGDFFDDAGQTEIAVADSALRALSDSLSIGGDEVPIVSDSLQVPTSELEADSVETLAAEIPADFVDVGVVDSTDVPRPDSLALADLVLDVSTEASLREPIYVEDLYQTIVDEYSGSPYAVRANLILSEIINIREAAKNALVRATSDSLLALAVDDSIRTALSVDSLGIQLPADSLITAVLFASPVVPDSTGKQEVIVDDVQSVDSFGNEIDDVTPNKNRSNTQDAVPSGDRPVPSPARSGDAARVAAAGAGVAAAVAFQGGEFPSFSVVEEEIEDEEILQLDSVKPLMENGKPDMRVVGWTVVIQVFDSLDETEQAMLLHNAIQDSTGIRLMILKDILGETTLYRLAWGIFPTLAATQSAIREENPDLPIGYSFLRLLPFEI